MEILASARRHGVTDENIGQAVAGALAVEEIGDDPLRYLVLGPDQAGNCSNSSSSTDRKGRP